LPGSGPQSASRARVLVRRATPFAALAAVFAVQALASADPVVAFPLYLAVVLLVSLQQDRAESVTVAVVAAIAVLIRPLAATGQASEVAPAVLLAAVLVAVAIAMNELTRHSREAAAAAQHKVDEIAASEQRLRATLESAQVGLALAHLDGRWVEVNEPLAAMLGRSCDEVVHGSLGEIVIADDRAALEEGLALLRAGDVTRWDAAIHLARADGAEVAAAAFIARIPNAAAGGASLLVQLADISARSRADQLRDCAGAVRQIIVTAVGLEGALPQLLGAFCDQLDWDVAQYWSPDADGQSMRARQASTVSDAPLEGFLHASRGLGVRSGAGLIGRVWRSGVVAAEEDIELNVDEVAEEFSIDEDLAVVDESPADATGAGDYTAGEDATRISGGLVDDGIDAETDAAFAALGMGDPAFDVDESSTEVHRGVDRVPACVSKITHRG